MSTSRPSKPTTTKKRGASPDDDQEATSSVPADAAATAGAQGNDQIFTSAPIHDRQSTFVAHFHPAPGVFAKQPSGTGPGTGSGSKPQLSLTATIKRLQAHPEFTSASHRIVAWRRRSSQQTLFTTATAASSGPSPAGAGGKAIYAAGSEDDGEKYAGKRLERLLADLDVEGVVVVARWYGGVLLGPVRFTHIETVAKEAVRKWKESVDASGGGGGGAGPKRQRLLDPNDGADGDDGDATELRSRLAEQLAERDRSIVVLRALLADKTKAASSPTEGANTPEPVQQAQQQSPSPAKKIDYSEMPLAKLRQLEKARDATIAFILKQLDKLEEEEKAREKEGQKPERGSTGADDSHDLEAR